MTDPIEVTPEILQSLADKIDGLELTAAERAVVQTVLARAVRGESEVEGYGLGGMPESPTTFKNSDGILGIWGTEWGRASGLIHEHQNPRT